MEHKLHHCKLFPAVQPRGAECMNTVVQPSPPSISRTFYLPELTLCPQ